MTKSKLVSIVAKQGHMTKNTANDAIEAFLDEIKRSLAKGEKVVISGFGTFYLTKVSDKSVVPFGDESKKKTIKGHRVVHFKVGQPLKKLVW